jgi:ABC-2 type transport system permease protein
MLAVVGSGARIAGERQTGWNRQLRNTPLGILLGHLLSTDAIGPAMGGIVSLFALLGGVWGPLASWGFMHGLSQSLPSYWLVEAGRSALGGALWPGRGWLVVGIWTAVLGRLAAHAYRRDTKRL